MNTINGENKDSFMMEENAVTEGGKTVREAHAPGVEWLPVSFLKDITIAWNWDDLLQDATAAEENMNLAIAGLVLSNDMESVFHHGETVLRQLGFEDIKSEYYSLFRHAVKDISNPARSFGHKKIEKDGKEYHIFCAAFRGTTTLSDAITDARSVMDGFYLGGRNCTDSLKEYISSFEGVSRENTILFITGHSLGASTANVAGRLSREIADDKAVFVYSFASPNYETEGEWEDGQSYPNFHYYTNLNDIVPLVPARIPPHNFAKIGIEHAYDYNTMKNDQKQRFLRVYRYFRGMTFEEDKDLLGLDLIETETLGYKALKNHLCHTYMSFLLSELSDQEINLYLAG